MPYLADHPPLHILVAAFVGVKSPGTSDSPKAMREAMATLGERRDVHEGFKDAVILDFDRLKAAARR